VNVAVTRCYRFPAAHILRRDDLSQVENERLYGKCANPAGHGHNYGVQVTVAGPVDAETGVVVDPAWLDGLVRERVVERLAHRLLNDDPAFQKNVPTAENILRFLEEELAGPIAARGHARLARVRVVETQRNAFETGDSA
jgi:6-pyruvoyltetrahydropterin/6-carboxytetrahydropterin synthase